MLRGRLRGGRLAAGGKFGRLVESAAKDTHSVAQKVVSLEVHRVDSTECKLALMEH